VETAFNAALEGATQVAARSITRIIFLDQALFSQFLPHNEGVFRPVKVIAPKGSIFNPIFPRGCIARFMQCNLLNDSVYLALAPALPERAVAGSAAEVHVIALAGINERSNDYWVYIGVCEGCWGGRYKKDGMDAIGCLMENVRNSPVEDDEWRYPLRHERYELRPVSPGAGRWRGGLGVIRRTRFLTSGWVSQEAERQLSRPRGIFGGQDGHAAATKVYREGRLIEELPSKYSGYKMQAGDVIEFHTACGGGYGAPHERDPAQVLADVLDGFLDEEEAAVVYGVRIRAEAIDKEETARLRSELATRST
jgi:N-methylhydantoinase B/oxoprolinase/acetone carboxylase alpha subunit